MGKTKMAIAALFSGVILVTSCGCERREPDIREYEIEKVDYDGSYTKPTYTLTLVNPKLQSDSLSVQIDKKNFNKSKNKVGKKLRLDLNAIKHGGRSIYRKAGFR